MTYETIILTELEAGIWQLTINRPKQLNALSPQVIGELGDAVRVLRSNNAVRCLLLTGAGEKAFVAGADISAMQGLTAVQGREFSLLTLEVFRSLETAAFPVIALVNGYALGGGCELAMACDWIIASEKAVFGQPEVNLGISPGFGGSQRLPRLVGRGMALDLLLTGRQIKVDEALRIGLVNQVVAPESLLETGLSQARLIASKGSLAVQYTKHLVHTGLSMDVENACRLEADVFGLLCATEDQKEGMQAFLEKRSPQFKAR